MASGGAPVQRQSFRPDIQGMRAIAVGLVVLYHAGLPVLTGGFVGVDIFFVISGFLITNHLLSTLDKEGRIPFASFYAKRARRILPASFVVIALTMIAAVIWMAPLALDDVFKDAVATALYVPNMLFAVQGTDYLAGSAPSLFQHYWSLGVEEQFYLVWPLFLLGVFLLGRRSRRVLFIGMLAFTVLSLVLCVILTQRSQPWAFFSLPTRAWELAIGGLLAFPQLQVRERIGRVPAAVLSWAGIAGLAVIAVTYTSATPFPGFAALGPVLASALVLGFADKAGSLGPARLLSLRGMVFIGTISYSLYLVHWPAMQIPAQAGGRVNEIPLWLGLLIAAACVPAAWLLYRYVEVPWQRLPVLASARPRRSLISAGLASVAVVAVAGAGLVALRAAPLTTDQSVTEASVLGIPPAFTPFVPANIEPALDAAAADNPDIYANGCHLGFAETAPLAECAWGEVDSAPLVALFGDSHAAQWFPALSVLAEDGVIRLETFTKSACPSVLVDKVRDGVPYTACGDWREIVLAQLEVSGADVVIVGNSHEGSTVDEWRDGLGDLIDRIGGQAQVIVMADTPRFSFGPAACLSANLEEAQACAEPASAAFDTEFADAESATATAHGAAYVDMNDYLCAEECGTVIGANLVYRDDNHIGATFGAELADPLSERISPYFAHPQPAGAVVP